MHPISSIDLKIGSDQKDFLRIKNPAVTVFIGPNNSGKSMLLREIQAFFANDHIPPSFILQNIKMAQPSSEVKKMMLDRLLNEVGLPLDIAEETSFQINRGNISFGTTTKDLFERAGDVESQGRYYHTLFLRNEVLLLDGSSRLGLTGVRGIDSYTQPKTSFGRLFLKDETRATLRAVLYKAFGKYLTLDAVTSPGSFMLRYSITSPRTLELEKGLTAESISHLVSGQPVDQMSDGVKALTGILIELYAGDPRILIIDEPEAFLHPSLARLLGHELSKPSAQVAQKNVFIATHSPNFLIGCVQAASSVNIVRLTYADGISTARHLDAVSVKALFRNPLLRSVNAIEALFYDHVVVVEADSDRAFYDEINLRLVAADDSRGIKNCLFLRAQNKQTVPNIVGPLRSLGIPAAGIVDVDIYKDGGSVWSNLLNAFGVPKVSQTGMAALRANLKLKFDEANKNPGRNGGINVLDGEDKKAGNDLFDQLAQYGLFVVRHGELESWLPGIASQSNKADWLVEALTNLGEDPASTEYKQPASGDVWDFIGEIEKWCKNPNRKGL